MDKIIGFGINESSTPNRLNASTDRLDFENGDGKYLGLIKIYNKHYVVTLALNGNNKGYIMVNEVLFDSYMDGETVFFYNRHKSRDCTMLENELNKPTLLSLIKDEGQDIYSVLERIGGIKKSPLRKSFENEFFKTQRTVFPEGYDFKRMLDPSKRDEFEKVDVERMSITGIDSELFETLRSVVDKYQSSFYSLARHYDETKTENEQLIQENIRLKKELENNQNNFRR